MSEIEQDPKRLSDRIGKTTLIIDALKNRIDGDSKTQLTIELWNDSHSIPGGFTEIVMKAIHAVLMQNRAIDTIHLARTAGVPAVADEGSDFTIVIQSQRALPPAGDEEDPHG